MPTYIKKPVAVEAFRLDANDAPPQWFIDAVGNRVFPMDDGNYLIRTWEGDMIARLGHFVVKGLRGELYPVKPEVFYETYDLAGGER